MDFKGLRKCGQVILSDLSDFVRSDKFPTVQVKVGQTRQQPYKVVCPVRFPVPDFCLFFFIREEPEEGGKLQDHLSRWIFARRRIDPA
jgi:hypothetical protein